MGKTPRRSVMYILMGGLHYPIDILALSQKQNTRIQVIPPPCKEIHHFLVSFCFFFCILFVLYCLVKNQIIIDYLSLSFLSVCSVFQPPHPCAQTSFLFINLFYTILPFFYSSIRYITRLHNGQCNKRLMRNGDKN